MKTVECSNIKGEDMKEFQVVKNRRIKIEKNGDWIPQVCPYNERFCTLECPRATLRDWEMQEYIDPRFTAATKLRASRGQVLTLCGVEYYNED